MSMFQEIKTVVTPAVGWALVYVTPEGHTSLWPVHAFVDLYQRRDDGRLITSRYPAPAAVEGLDVCGVIEWPCEIRNEKRDIEQTPEAVIYIGEAAYIELYKNLLPNIAKAGVEEIEINTGVYQHTA